MNERVFKQSKTELFKYESSSHQKSNEEQPSNIQHNEEFNKNSLLFYSI